ncbi:MAG: hypothetical protein Q8O94_02380 [bacterium]|nr:hypothetical protein [bacterium]
MSIHNEEVERVRQMLDEISGGERKWPHGRVSDDDDGETTIAIMADLQYKIIRIQFTKPMAWLGLDVKSARELVRLLSEKAGELEQASATSAD